MVDVVDVGIGCFGCMTGGVLGYLHVHGWKILEMIHSALQYEDGLYDKRTT